MEIKTGYFYNMSKYKEAGFTPVCIARFPPKGLENKCYKIPELAPSAKLLQQFKDRTGTGAHNLDEEYNRGYINEVEGKIREALVKLGTIKNPILLCYEKDPSQCHRSLLANYINEHYPEHHVEEFSFTKQKDDDFELD